MNYNILNKSQLIKGLAFFYFLLVTLFSFSKPALAGDLSLNNQQMEQWMVLNYYHKSFNGKYSSEISNGDFFLSKNGQHDPYDEFNVFVDTVKTYLADGKNKDVLCKFPARLSFLEKNFNILNKKDRPFCPEYEEKNRFDKITSISLVFASGYFDNPGSYYGHTLIKYNYGNDVLNQTSLDSSLNYGANATDDAGSPLYAIKGLLGFYDATYSRNNNFIYSNLYTNSQIRDIWEYELDLSKPQIKFLVEHSWEMMNAKFKYYFFNDNCANRIARLIELATGQDLSKTHGLWLLPMQVIRKLGRNNPASSLVKKVGYNPSLKTVFSSKFNTLDSKSKDRFVKFFYSTDEEKRKNVNTFDSDQLYMILDYMDLKVAKLTLKKKDVEKINEMNKQRAIILGELLSRPSDKITRNYDIKDAPSPAETKPTSVLRLGYGMREGSQFARVGYRVTNNDFLNVPTPGQEISQFFMGDFEAEIRDGRIDINKATIVEIANLNTNPLPMKMTGEYSWALKGDYSARNDLCINCSTLGIEGKVGKAFRINEDILVYGMAGPRLHTPEPDRDDFVTLKSEAGTIINPSEKTVLGIFGEVNYNTDLGNADNLLRAEFSYNPHNDFDYRVKMQANENTASVIFSIGYYFD